LSQDHIILVDNELRCGHDATTITQDIAGVLLIEEDEGDTSKENQLLMDIEMWYEECSVMPVMNFSFVEVANGRLVTTRHAGLE
ncbi:Hypothetical predicted protein, partial [Paramuricea clavata]